MNNLMRLLVFTLMLRVWYQDANIKLSGGLPAQVRAEVYGPIKEGILIGTFGDRRSLPLLLIRQDSGIIDSILLQQISKSKWVEVKE